jgi:hypothetical protein
MALQATASGAAVYLEASPARNPATTPGSFRSGGVAEYGFNGVPQLNQLLLSLAHSPMGLVDHWHYDNTAAANLSGHAVTADQTSFEWQLHLACTTQNTKNCVKGVVGVRAGGTDAIHLDRSGAGARRLAQGIESAPLRDFTSS